MNTTEENAVLKEIVKDIWWMAKRYADYRMTYAVGMYNDAIDKAIELGLKIKPDLTKGGDGIHARDGMFDSSSNILYRDS